MNGISVITKPAERPVALAELKDHLRLLGDDGSQNAMLEGLIGAATLMIEDETGRALVTRELRLHLAGFPADGVIRLPLPPTIEVTAVRHRDDADEWVELAAADYQADVHRAPARVAPASGQSWPAVTRGFGVVQVDYTAGYGQAADVPESLRHAVLMIAAHLFENPQAVMTGTIATQIPLAVQTIVAQYAMPRL